MNAKEIIRTMELNPNWRLMRTISEEKWTLGDKDIFGKVDQFVANRTMTALKRSGRIVEDTDMEKQYSALIVYMLASASIPDDEPTDDIGTMTDDAVAARAIAAEEAGTPVYEYGFRNRPAIEAAPSGWFDWQAATGERLDRMHGTAKYNRALTHQEMTDYELFPVSANAYEFQVGAQVMDDADDVYEVTGHDDGWYELTLQADPTYTKSARWNKVVAVSPTASDDDVADSFDAIEAAFVAEFTEALSALEDEAMNTLAAGEHLLASAVPATDALIASDPGGAGLAAARGEFAVGDRVVVHDKTSAANGEEGRIIHIAHTPYIPFHVLLKERGQIWAFDADELRKLDAPTPDPLAAAQAEIARLQAEVNRLAACDTMLTQGLADVFSKHGAIYHFDMSAVGQVENVLNLKREVINDLRQLLADVDNTAPANTSAIEDEGFQQAIDNVREYRYLHNLS